MQMGARVDGAVYQNVDAVRKRRYTHDEYKDVELVHYVRSRVRRRLFALRSSKYKTVIPMVSFSGGCLK
jgi:hypothetical protein